MVSVGVAKHNLAVLTAGLRRYRLILGRVLELLGIIFQRAEDALHFFLLFCRTVLEVWCLFGKAGVIGGIIRNTT